MMLLLFILHQTPLLDPFVLNFVLHRTPSLDPFVLNGNEMSTKRNSTHKQSCRINFSLMAIKL